MGARPPAPAPESQQDAVVDLMAALESSVRTARESRGEDATIHEMPKPARKGAKKTPAKKTTTTTPKAPRRGRSA
ncbi:hypothetical protein [Streptomyces sp. NPDC095613]|uniref:hypothetical protein n=1 Tax=Streptomyces sp. NPDC095613 TaxID=3155540 RepID=UPI00332A3194